MNGRSPPGIPLPPYLPHLKDPEILQMGLSPLGNQPWIETDSELPAFHAHKRRQRAQHGANVYRCAPQSLPAQQEFAQLLLTHLTQEQGQYYALQKDRLEYIPGKLALPLTDTEVLWCASLWIADDIVLLLPEGEDYILSAASLCSPSHWRLQDKFGQPLWQVHKPIPGFHDKLTPSIDRFLKHLRPEHPVVRYNWSLQAGDALHPADETAATVSSTTALFYRTERQSLRRLPDTGAIAFTIRVYLHPLATLAQVPGALEALLNAVENTPPSLARYKAFDRLAPALQKYQVTPDA